MRLANCQAGRQAVCHERNNKKVMQTRLKMVSVEELCLLTQEMKLVLRDEIGSLDHSSLFM